MSGKRLLDAAALYRATKSVASKHVALRTHQFEAYGKTSSLARAVKNQTDRVTRPVKAASALTGRSQESGNRHSTQASTTQPTSVPRPDSVQSPSSTPGKKEGLQQDHFYERSERNASVQPPPDHDIGVKQEKAQRYPLPDGSIPPADSELANPPQDGESYSQRPQAQPVKDPIAKDTDQTDGKLQPTASGRSSIPKPSRASDGQDQAVPHQQAIPQQNEPSEEMYSELFHSPKIAKMLKGKPKPTDSAEGLDLQGVKETPSRDDGSILAGDPGSFNTRSTAESQAKGAEAQKAPQQPGRSSKLPEDGMKSLAADIADDARQAPADGERIPSETIDMPAKGPYQMHESRVPSSRFGRLWQYGGLATSMAFGAVGESFRRVTSSDQGSGGSLMLSAANMERLVAKLSRMRGAALKLGQMMSFQDAKMLPAPIHEVLQRVQDSADYMPAWQRDQVLASNLGADWRDLFSSFSEKPIAAASIGQVHSATVKSTGTRVAVKIQYPGVADSIDSDLNNLAVLLTASRLLPKGLYLDKTIANARTELAWECDYIREAECGRRFQKLLEDEQETFVVPSVIEEASGAQVLTAEMMDGIGVTKAQNLNQEQKDWVGTQILRLCLREITEFKFMQTDPNWTNYLFNAKTSKLELLDFGASRDYPDKFIIPYVQILQAASRNDRETIRERSIELGYLTGHESKAMLDAHVSSVLTLAEPFNESSPEVYDFRDQTITDRVRGLIPVMIRERLAPPPEETYSLHRKLSGAFLLCARLGSRVKCKELFANAMVKVPI
ncbi:MAG: hypothetical protein Q9218_001215 [Villophora microphyllina]